MVDSWERKRLSQIALEKYKLVLNQLSGSMFSPIKIQQTCVPEK